MYTAIAGQSTHALQKSSQALVRRHAEGQPRCGAMMYRIIMMSPRLRCSKKLPGRQCYASHGLLRRQVACILPAAQNWQARHAFM